MVSVLRQYPNVQLIRFRISCHGRQLLGIVVFYSSEEPLNYVTTHTRAAITEIRNRFFGFFGKGCKLHA